MKALVSPTSTSNGDRVSGRHVKERAGQSGHGQHIMCVMMIVNLALMHRFPRPQT